MSLLVVLAWACADEKEVSGEKVWDTSLTFNMTRAPEAVINNTQVYLFDGEGAAVNQFRQKIPDITYAPDRLKMPVAAGTWNIALVSAEADINGRIISPIRGQDRNVLKMWETTPVSGVLPTVPELRTAYLSGQHILAGQENVSSETALLSRNVALVKVVIADAGGLDVNGTHTFKLTQVPTTLNWNGGLYPDKNHPAVRTEPMIGSFQVRNNPTQVGHQLSDTLRFVIPAHKGSDYLSAQPIDTTTHNLRLSVDLACDGGTRFEKADVIIPRVPRVNGILLVRLFLGGKLDVTTEILDWVDTQINADLSQTQLFTDKTSINLSFKDTLHVNTNAETFTVSKAPDAAWITSVRKLDGNAVEVTADINTYVDNNPRTSYITIKANNVTKKIPVTQRPDKGTIKIDVHKLVLCPNLHQTGTINVTSVGGGWKFLATTPKASTSVQNGVTGTTPVTFTRSSTTNVSNFDTYYGDAQLVVKNTTTLDTDTLSLLNCFIYMDQNTINAASPTGTVQTAVTNSQDISVYGGNRNIVFDSWSNWIHSGITWSNASQTLTMTTDREPNDEPRQGFLTFHHAECPDYSVTAKVYQDIIVTIPAFDFFVLKFTWLGDDVDIAVEFAGNNLSGNGTNNATYDKHPVGWSFSSAVTYNTRQLLQWGGDAQGGQGETTFFNAPVLEGDVNSPRKVKLDVYATWYTAGRAPSKMTFTMTAYKGGTMVQSGTNFNNNGGVKLYDQGHSVMITTTKGNSTYATGGYTKVATITYDRVKHSASVSVWAGLAARSTRTAESVSIPLRPEVKPYWLPTIVHTYSDDYRGERK